MPTGHPGAPVSETGDALRTLAEMLRAGFTPENALIGWYQRAGEAWKEPLAKVGMRVRLGVSPHEAFEGDPLGDISRILAAIFCGYSTAGGDLASAVDELATEADRIDAGSRSAAAQVAGARLSARMIAALPLAFVPLVPGAGSPVGDPFAMTTTALGVGLVGLGMAWIKRLLPSPPSPGSAATAASMVASALRGGSTPAAALDAAAETWPALAEARSRTRMGLSWDEALRVSDDEGMRALGDELAGAALSGAPAAERLAAFARSRSSNAACEFTAEARRAPVRMIVPLTLCILPAFLLLGAGPLVRGLGG
jgi:tight adherence protein B